MVLGLNPEIVRPVLWCTKLGAWHCFCWALGYIWQVEFGEGDWVWYSIWILIWKKNGLGIFISIKKKVPFGSWKLEKWYQIDKCGGKLFAIHKIHLLYVGVLCL